MIVEELPRHQNHWLNRSLRSLYTAQALEDAFQEAELQESAVERGKRWRVKAERRRERVLREEQWRAQEDGRRRGRRERVEWCRRLEEEVQREQGEAHETLVQRAKRRRMEREREKARQQGRQAAEEWERR